MGSCNIALPQSKYEYGDADYCKFRRYASIMLWGFVIMYLFFYNGRQNINLAMPLMMEDLNVSNAQMGIVTSALFWCYGFGHLFSGRLGEMIGNKSYMVVGAIVSVVLNVLISFQSSLIFIAILWGLNGFAQSAVWSPGIAMSSKWWPKETRGYASGVISGASGMAQVVTYGCVLAALTLFPADGWRAAFRWPLLPTFLLILLFWFIVKEEPRHIGLNDFKENDPEAAALEKAHLKAIQGKGFLHPYICLLREPKMCIFLLVIAIAGIGRYGMLTWIPTYFQENMGVDIKSGILSAFLLPVGQTVAFFLMPFLSDKIFKGKREPLLILCGAVAAITLFIFPAVTSQTTASVLLFIVGFFATVNGIIWAFAGDIGTRAFAGTAAGLLDWTAYMGAAIQSILFGFVSGYSWSAVFVTIGILYVFLIVLALIARKLKIKGTIHA